MRQLASIVILYALGSGNHLAAEACATVDDDRIRAANLAELLPAFREIDPTTVIGYAPAPGLQRSFSASRLRRVLQQHGLKSPEATSVCFERFTEPLSEQRILAALKMALAAPEADVKVIEFSQQAIPTGELHFEKNGLRVPLNATPETPLLWRGTLLYGERRSVPVWARVRIRVRRNVVVALRNLPAGEPVRPEDIELRTEDVVPTADAGFEDSEALVGAIPRRTIEAGQALYPLDVVQPNDVNRGEMVLVEVTCGAARLQLEAKAESSGRRGDRINVVNQTNKQRFPAVVQGRRKVSVRPVAERGQP